MGLCLRDPSLLLAIFVAFLAFNGLIGSAMNELKRSGSGTHDPTDSSKTLPGSTCLRASAWPALVAKKLEQHMPTAETGEAV